MCELKLCVVMEAFTDCVRKSQLHDLNPQTRLLFLRAFFLEERRAFSSSFTFFEVVRLMPPVHGPRASRQLNH